MVLPEIRAAWRVSEQRIAESPAMQTDTWDLDENIASYYDLIFHQALGHTVVEEINNLQIKFGHVRAANVMGGLTILRDLPVDEGWAVRLKDTRLPEIKFQDDQQHLFVIPGDIRYKSTLSKLPDDLHIILGMPQGGEVSLPNHPFFYYRVGSDLVEKLAVGGIGIFQMPPNTNQWMTDYVAHIEPSPDISVSYLSTKDNDYHSYGVFTVRKLSEDAKLPTK